MIRDPWADLGCIRALFFCGFKAILSQDPKLTARWWVGGMGRVRLKISGEGKLFHFLPSRPKFFASLWQVPRDLRRGLESFLLVPVAVLRVCCSVGVLILYFISSLMHLLLPLILPFETLALLREEDSQMNKMQVLFLRDWKNSEADEHPSS